MKSTTSRITWLTVRVCVHVPRGYKLPDRVRVIVKERGAIFFPFQIKLMSIPLYKAGWRMLEGNVWFNEQAMAAPVEMGKLLKRAEKRQLALQLYCLKGRTVEHKALGGFARLMHQVRNGELFLTLNYSGCQRYQQEVFPVTSGKGCDAKARSPSPSSATNLATSVSPVFRNAKHPAVKNKSSCALSAFPSSPDLAVSPAPSLAPCTPFSTLLRLAEEDRQDILNQRWLSDDVMDLAQEIIQRVSRETRGLYTPASAFTLDPLDPADDTLFLQVVNRSTPTSLSSMADYLSLAGTHWLLATNFGAGRGCLHLYDSLFTSASPSTAELTRHLLSRSAQPRVTFPRVHQQRDSYSCGMYTIAFAFSIAVGEDPASRLYQRERMAPHLLECLELGRLKPFPSRSVSGLQQGCGATVTTNVSHRDFCHRGPAEPKLKVVQEEVKDCLERVTSPPTPRRVLFSESGSVFGELLCEYDIRAAQEEAKAKKASEERAAASTVVKEQACSQQTGSRWRKRLLALGATAIHFWVIVLAVQEIRLRGALGAMLLSFLVTLGYYCYWIL